MEISQTQSSWFGAGLLKMTTYGVFTVAVEAMGIPVPAQQSVPAPLPAGLHFRIPDLSRQTSGTNPTPRPDIGEAMADAPSREEIDAKLAALDSKGDARFKELMGEMRTSQANLAGEMRTAQAELSGRITGAIGELRTELQGDYKALKAATAGRLTVILTGISTALAVLAISVALIIGMATSGQQMFGLGQATHDAAAAAGLAAAEHVLQSQKK